MGSRCSSAALPQPDTGSPAPVRLDEFDARLFKRVPQCPQDGAPRLRRAALKLPQRDLANERFPSEVSLSPIYERPGGTALSWCHGLSIPFLSFFVNYDVLRQYSPVCFSK
jgi:hypothetical protein